MERPYFNATPGSTTVVTVKVWPDPPQAVVLAEALAVVLAVALAVRARVWPDPPLTVRALVVALAARALLAATHSLLTTSSRHSSKGGSGTTACGITLAKRSAELKAKRKEYMLW